ncbi:MAG: hypothetical protein AAFP86_01195 [Planctomycetota bacterium]
MTHHVRPTSIALSTVLLLAGCVDLGPRDSTPIRFFSADPPRAVDGSEGTANVVVASVRGAEHLAERVVWRGAGPELGFHEDLRWSEPPAVSLERRLLRAFPGVRAEPSAFRLEATLEALEEVRVGSHEGRAVVSVALRRGTGTLVLRRTCEGLAPIAAEDGSSVAQGLVDALDRATEAATSAVRAEVDRAGG